MNKAARATVLLLALAAVTFPPPEGTAAAPLPPMAVGKDGAEMSLVPRGEFIMGTREEDLADVAPEHEVFLDSYYIDRHEVTNGQFASFLNAAKPGEEKFGKRWRWVVLRSDLEFVERASWWPTEILYENSGYVAFEGYEMLPVISVSWEAAGAYCEWAGKRLPTEAEWEKAARGGLKRKVYPWGNELPTVGIVYGRRWQDNQVPAPVGYVGNYYPNGYGLFDMAGNVWEWCSDWYDAGYYGKSPRENPKGPEKGNSKVSRGGSWYNSAFSLRVALRNFTPPDALNDAFGFRCAMDASEAIASGGEVASKSSSTYDDEKEDHGTE